MTTSADLRALAERYRHRRRAASDELALLTADDLAYAVIRYLDPATTNAVIATQLRREIAEKQEALDRVLARGVGDAVGVE